MKKIIYFSKQIMSKRLKKFFSSLNKYWTNTFNAVAELMQVLMPPFCALHVSFKFLFRILLLQKTTGYNFKFLGMSYDSNRKFCILTPVSIMRSPSEKLIKLFFFFFQTTCQTIFFSFYVKRLRAINQATKWAISVVKEEEKNVRFFFLIYLFQLPFERQSTEEAFY